MVTVIKIYLFDRIEIFIFSGNEETSGTDEVSHLSLGRLFEPTRHLQIENK
jgi:hypothetical protein